MNERLRAESEHRCVGKKKHRTYKKAVKARDRRSQMFAVELFVYECRRCGFWHLSHLEPESIPGAVTVELQPKR